MNKRRKMIIALGASALTASLASFAQLPGKVWRVGILIGGSANDPLSQAQLTALRDGLQQRGWMEGSNLKIDNR